MAYIDFDFYISVYKGAYVDPNDFDLYSERACDIIDGITAGCASHAAKDDEKTDTAKKKAAKLAACAQTEYLLFLGNKEYLGIAGKEISREEVGNAAVSYRKEKGVSYLGIPVCGLALMYLKGSGLILRGI
jgi:hypothetical protein